MHTSTSGQYVFFRTCAPRDRYQVSSHAHARRRAANYLLQPLSDRVNDILQVGPNCLHGHQLPNLWISSSSSSSSILISPHAIPRRNLSRHVTAYR